MLYTWVTLCCIIWNNASIQNLSCGLRMKIGQQRTYSLDQYFLARSCCITFLGEVQQVYSLIATASCKIKLFYIFKFFDIRFFVYWKHCVNHNNLWSSSHLSLYAILYSLELQITYKYLLRSYFILQLLALYRKYTYHSSFDTFLQQFYHVIAAYLTS